MITVITQSHIDRYSLPDYNRIEHIPHSVEFGPQTGFLSRDTSTALIPYTDTSYTLLNTWTGESRIVDHGVTPTGSYILSPNGSSMVVNEDDIFSDTIRDVSTGNVLYTTDNEILKLCWSLNNERVAYYRNDSNVFCIDAQSSEAFWAQEIKSDDEIIEGMAFSDDGRILVVLFESEVFVLNAETGNIISNFECSYSGDMIYVSPDNSRVLLFSSSNSYNSVVLSLKDGSEINWNFSRRIYAAAWSLDSDSIIAVTGDGVYRIFPVEDDKDKEPRRALELENVKSVGIAPPSVILL
jgi:hypothetical protein